MSHGEEILGVLTDIAGDVGSLKSDVGSLKSDVGSLRSDLEYVKRDISDLKNAPAWYSKADWPKIGKGIAYIILSVAALVGGGAGVSSLLGFFK